MDFIYLYKIEPLAIALSGVGKGLRRRKDEDDLVNIILIKIVTMNSPI
jgi:hypothetical protein